MVFDSKKGVSPLIAAVLLIVVTVGIGAVVTGIIRSQVTSDKQTIEKTSTDVDCSTQVQINVPVYNDQFRICYTAENTGTVNFTLENIGSMEIDDLQVKVYGETGFTDADNVLPTGLAPGQTNISVLASYTAVGTLQEIHIVPKKKVTAAANKIYCGEAALKFAKTDLNTC
jgi:flagellin-like protein